MKPAARISDMHACPMQTPGTPPIPHVGGPIVATGVPTVLVEGLVASVLGDVCICVGPPDAVAEGSPTVTIGGKPAARLGDKTVHGGAIVQGAATTLIGDMGGGSATPQGATMREARQTASAFTHTACATKVAQSKAADNDAPPPAHDDVTKHWVEIELLDQHGKPVPQARYRIVTPEKRIVDGYTDERGGARVAGIDPGTCTITFPDLDAATWKPA